MNAECGDGYVQTGSEACDDGMNGVADDCKDDCTENICGDGVIQTAGN